MDGSFIDEVVFEMRVSFHSFAANDKRAESGQVMLFVLLLLGLILVGAIAFAVDLSNLWFHRQAAQTAADAACGAGAMDELVNSVNGATLGNFPQGATAGSTIDCNTNTSFVPCQYAALNGYNSSIAMGGTTIGNNVSVLLQSPSALPPVTIGLGMQVSVTDNVPAYFAGVISRGSIHESVQASSRCGVTPVAAAVPLAVLNPQGSGTLSLQQGKVTIFGGGSQTIQVNSADPNAVTATGNTQLDLSQAGPSNNGSVGLWGGPSTPPGGLNFIPGSNQGGWFQPSAPVNDPFASLSVPPVPSQAPPPQPGAAGCPQAAQQNCMEYSPGYYPQTIQVGTQGQPPGGTQGQPAIAVFDPGLYYLAGGLDAGRSSCLLNSTAPGPPGQQWGGVMFYLSGGATVHISSSSGQLCPPFSTNSGTGSLPFGVYCSANSWPQSASNLPASITGNVLLAPCSGPYGDPYLARGQPAPPGLGQQRGVLFFQDPLATQVQAQLGGPGSFWGGAIYIHSCGSGNSPTGCGSAPTYFSDVLTLAVGRRAPLYVLGSIVVDNLVINGRGPNAAFNIFLNPTTGYNLWKATLLP